MTKANQILRDIKLSEILETELNPLSKKVKDYIDCKLNGLVKFEMYEYPNYIFYKKDDIILFEHDLKNNVLWCSWQHYWSFFMKIICISYHEIGKLTECLVKTYLNLKKIEYSKNIEDGEMSMSELKSDVKNLLLKYSGGTEIQNLTVKEFGVMCNFIIEIIKEPIKYIK